MISGHTRVFGLIGHPVRHSLSPAMYNELFRRCGIDAVYVAMDVDPGRAERVAEAVRTLDLVGVNLTVPFKERVLPHLDRLTLAAEEAGAVNVVIHNSGTLTGYNTDGEGLVRSLEELGLRSWAGRQVVVLGAGGTARAVGAALLDRGVAGLCLLNRSLPRAEAAAEALAHRYPRAGVEADLLLPGAFSARAAEAELVVNCTTGPAAPLVEALDPSALPLGATWVDANYWMAEPPQQGRCAELGLRYCTGHSMLIHQGALAFELFTGYPVSPAEIRRFLEPGS